MCLAVIGPLISAFGSIAAGMQAKRDAEYQAAILERNARHAEQMAAAEAERFRHKADRMESSLLVSQAASGVDTESGSPLTMASEMARQLQLDHQIIIHGGAVQAASDRESARQAIAQGKQSMLGGFINAGTSLLTSDDLWKSLSTQGAVSPTPERAPRNTSLDAANRTVPWPTFS